MSNVTLFGFPRSTFVKVCGLILTARNVEYRFHDTEEAIRIANGTNYGLASAIWTSNIKLAHKVAAEIKSGVVWINTYNAFDSGSTFGGYKQSGYGRDLGQEALDQYTSTKSIWVAL